MCRLRVLNDSPMTMREREFGNILSSFNPSLFTNTASEAEVLSMYINKDEPYRRKTAITKIFRRSKYSPKLEDIEEKPEDIESEDILSSARLLNLSLSCIHLERAISTGIMAQASRRRRRHSANSTSKEERNPRREHRRSRRTVGEKLRA